MCHFLKTNLNIVANLPILKQSGGPLIIDGKVKDLGGGFQVSRYLPTIKKRSVGPFIFLDEMGPVMASSQTKLDVRPHPHIGLSTVTYLLRGEGLHRDSLGSTQVIRPGDINLMTAGKGITHSERTRDSFLALPEDQRVLHGLQFWMALPKELEDCEPAFSHYPKIQFPQFEINKNISCRILMGQGFGETSPIHTPFKTLFLDLKTSGPAELDCQLDVAEYAILVIEADSKSETLINDDNIKKGTLLYSDSPQLKFSTSGRIQFLLFGGEKLPEPRHMWWNFVSTSKEKIHEAAANWKAGKFPEVPGEVDFIPLPADPLP
jgi:redox-sensitive bicupin YhaK (pirin superfamily)